VSEVARSGVRLLSSLGSDMFTTPYSIIDLHATDLGFAIDVGLDRNERVRHLDERMAGIDFIGLEHVVKVWEFENMNEYLLLYSISKRSEREALSKATSHCSDQP